jgi:hypothetical protein
LIALGLRDHQNIIFFRNDPKVIHAIHGTGITYRKPDIILAFITDVSQRITHGTGKRANRQEETVAVDDLHEASAAASSNDIVEFVEWDKVRKAVEFKLGTPEQRKRKYEIPKKYEVRTSAIDKLDPLDVDVEGAVSTESEESKALKVSEEAGKRKILFNVVQRSDIQLRLGSQVGFHRYPQFSTCRCKYQ